MIIIESFSDKVYNSYSDAEKDCNFINKLKDVSLKGHMKRSVIKTQKGYQILFQSIADNQENTKPFLFENMLAKEI